jgi:glycosyltransferase involved in cell wall biosynthesis
MGSCWTHLLPDFRIPFNDYPQSDVTDAAVIQEYYMQRYRAPSVMIAYGTRCDRLETTEVLDRLEVKSRGYALYVSRLEPENNAHLVIDAFASVQTRMPLLIVGDTPYAQDCIARLKATSDSRVRFTGGIYGTGYRELQSHAFIYVHATEVGGTHPALIEAMGAGNCVIVYDTPESRSHWRLRTCFQGMLRPDSPDPEDDR